MPGYLLVWQLLSWNSLIKPKVPIKRPLNLNQDSYLHGRYVCSWPHFPYCMKPASMNNSVAIQIVCREERTRCHAPSGWPLLPIPMLLLHLTSLSSTWVSPALKSCSSSPLPYISCSFCPPILICYCNELRATANKNATHFFCCYSFGRGLVLYILLVFPQMFVLACVTPSLPHVGA